MTPGTTLIGTLPEKEFPPLLVGADSADVLELEVE
jgi:hypothetical protein